ncbi:MAG TPA: roadblock/LC7 domain-containing protein [Desulfuromonadales bacterium]|nr:roadblock/LC7 domain-containing protein [Desulfuromonadales bacterium]
MSLRDNLSSIVASVDGAMAAMIMAYDGIPIDEVVQPDADMDLQLLSVEYTTILKEIKRAVEVLKAGEMEEVSISTTRTRIVVRVLNSDLFAALIMKHDGNYGKGRYLLRLKGSTMAEELS